MSSDELPPPAAACLERPYPSRQKGGTLIAESVYEIAQHRALLSDPDGYRPAACPRCGHRVVHAHDFRERQLRADMQWGPRIMTRRYRCAWRACGARWQVLPVFVARWLWRSWRVVEQTLGIGEACWGRAKVPQPTAQRWRQRLRSAARSVVQALAASSEPTLARVAQVIGLTATRAVLVQAYDGPVAALAGLTHRLVPGLRLM